MPPKTFKILTIGCKVNQYESRAVETELNSLGALRVGEDEPAELYILNTCTVTHRSDSDARALIRRLKRENPGCRVAVAGCFAALEPETAIEAGADVVLASSDKTGLAALALSAECGIVRPKVHASPTLPPMERFSDRKRAYLKVQDGCDVYCAYCIVPFARGPSRSLPPDEVALGLSRLAQAGHMEVVLTGIHLGFWGKDLTPRSDLDELIEIAEKSSVEQIRLSSLEPLEVTDELLAKMATSKKLCPHLHIPLQSGCDRTLAAMGRPYMAAEARERIDAALAALEGLNLGFDVITGFPGESDADFEETFDFLKAIPFSYLHVFPFSPRKGTKAFSLADRPPPHVAAARAARLRELAKVKKEEFQRAQIGRKVFVIPEKKTNRGTLFGHASNYLEVELPWEGEIPRSRIAARLVGLTNGRLSAEAGGN